MKYTLYDFKEIIQSLPLQDRYSKEELLIPELLIEKKDTIEIYYAPHNEYINPTAKVFIIGITHGFPHPSGANVNRLIQFNENNLDMIKYINEWKIEALRYR